MQYWQWRGAKCYTSSLQERLNLKISYRKIRYKITNCLSEKAAHPTVKMNAELLGFEAVDVCWHLVTKVLTHTLSKLRICQIRAYSLSNPMILSHSDLISMQGEWNTLSRVIYQACDIKLLRWRLAGVIFHWNNDISLSFCILIEVFSRKCHICLQSPEINSLVGFKAAHISFQQLN